MRFRLTEKAAKLLQDHAVEMNAELATMPDAWFWCEVCERVCRGHELREGRHSEMSRCPQPGCTADGFRVFVHPYNDDGTFGSFKRLGQGPVTSRLTSGDVVRRQPN